ncbi:MAG: hypothetical protein IT209_02265 [Armatimonadetes bacterium]|nr:hypothetical protein [Armatimonadota bacterium]
MFRRLASVVIALAAAGVLILRSGQKTAQPSGYELARETPPEISIVAGERTTIFANLSLDGSPVDGATFDITISGGRQLPRNHDPSTIGAAKAATPGDGITLRSAGSPGVPAGGHRVLSSKVGPS